MKHKDYVNAIDKLEFSNDLLHRVRTSDRVKLRFRGVRAAVLAAVLACFMITTAFGAISALRERPGNVEVLGKDAEELGNAQYMHFTVSQGNEDVQKHYMELHPAHSYHFRHGMLRSEQGDYLRITQDYQLERMQMIEVHLALEKNDRTYYLDFTYQDTAGGVISDHRSVYQKNEQGEFLLNATDGNSSQWPVYFNPETGTIRDALPDWSEGDFEGRIGGASELKGGLLVSTIVNDGLPDARNNLYWIAPGAEEARIIQLPGNGMWHGEHDTIYYQNDLGHLYCMDDNFEFQLISAYGTSDYLQDGLLTVSAQGNLGILDAYTGELYVFEEIEVSTTDTRNYHAIRYGADGTIALVHTEWVHDPERIVLCTLGVLDKQSAQLKLLQIENSYDGGRCNWLDENRLAVIYQSDMEQFLCVYEFDS